MNNRDSTQMKVRIDKQSLCIVIDKEINRAIGTGFSFLKETWVITAKHVVIKNGAPRMGIRLSFLDNELVKAKVIAVHPELDLALLNYEGPSLCKRPLMPGYHEFTSSNQLFMCGYSPSYSVGDDLTMNINLISDFKIEERNREEPELVIHFKANYSEGGNSGGPILGEGGNVVAVAIQTYEKEDGKYCVATSIRTILRNLNFGDGWISYEESKQE